MAAPEPTDGRAEAGPAGADAEQVSQQEVGGEPAAAAPYAEKRPRRVWPALLLSGLLGGGVGAGGVLWLDRTGNLPLGAPGTDPAGAPSAEIAALTSQVEQLRQAQAQAKAGPDGPGLQPEVLDPLRQQVAALEQTVGELSLQAPGGPGNEALAPIELRLAELEARAGQAGPDLQPIEQRLAALESRPAAAGTDLGPIEARIAALESRPAAAGADLAPFEARIAELETRVDQTGAPAVDPALEARLAELNARVAEAVGPEAIVALETRLDDTAGQLQELRDRPPVDLSGVEGAIADLRTRMDEFGNRLAAVPTQEQVAALEGAVQGAAKAEQVTALEAQLAAAPKEERVATLESALNETQAQAEKAAGLGPAIAANALTAALGSGAPYRAELDALRALGLDAAALEGLAQHADAGLPTAPELRAGFDQAIAGVDLSQPIPESAGAVNRLLQSARSLVEVRAAGPATGTEPAAIAGRLRAALDAGNLQAALTEWQSLPEQAKASTAEWARLAQARADAEELAARLRTEALSRIAAGG